MTFDQELSASIRAKWPEAMMAHSDEEILAAYACWRVCTEQDWKNFPYLLHAETRRKTWNLNHR